MTASLGKICADFSSTLNLKTAIGATSATLDSATDDDGVALPTGTYFLTLDRKSANKEYIKCTLTSTALTDIYHVSRQGALTSGTTKTHRKGATVEITDFAIIKKMLDLLDGTTSFNASVPLGYDGTATISTANQFATKAYVDATATGTTNFDQVVIAGNAGATVSAGQLLYLDVADGEWKLCDADTAATVDNIILGLAQGAGTDGNPITGGILTYGLDTNQTGLTTNTAYYASNTAGAISSSAGTVEVSVGVSRSTTSLFFDPRYNQQITEDIQDALVGTSGTPSSTNKYVTNDDTATAATADKVARRLAGGNITVVTETTGNNTTNAASTAFVQQELAAGPNFANVPNVGVVPTTYFTHSMNVDADLGWTVTGTPTNNGNWYSISGATNTRLTIPLAGRPNSDSATLQWNSGIDFKMTYLHTQKNISAGVSPAGAGDFWLWHGVTTAATPASTVADITDVSRRAGFAHYNGRIYAITADGTTVTATNIQADAALTKRQFMIDFTTTSVKFYINGVLVATHTTNIPNDANNIFVNFGGYDGDGGTKGDFGISNDIIFSETLN